jgi:hypothetical protein
MPIKPENRHRYPADWKQIRARILLRANYRCEAPGCRAKHGVTGYWHDSRFTPMPDALWYAGAKLGDRIACADGNTIKIIKIVLTIAHLDHQPENCADDNLRAWCQRHHLGYDAKHHAATAAATRRARANTLDLF